MTLPLVRRRRWQLVQIAFLLGASKYACTLLQLRRLSDEGQSPMMAMRQVRQQEQQPKSGRVILATRLNASAVQIVSTSSWAKPSADYKIDSSDLWEDDEFVPVWMKNYFRWHKEQRSAQNWDKVRYFFVPCLKTSRKCGGTADRLISLPFFLKVAAETHRLLLIKWERPTAALEDFLLPPIGGLDWRVPVRLLPKLLEGPKAFSEQSILHVARNSSVPVLHARFQAHDHGSIHYNMYAVESVTEATFRIVIRSVWRTMFTPVPELAGQIRRTLEQRQLIPGDYVAVHLRAHYHAAKRENGVVGKWARNAVRCASQLSLQSKQQQQQGIIYFASDSQFAVQRAVSYGKAKGWKMKSREQAAVSNPLHIDKTVDWADREPADFYDTFVDLYLLGFSRCVAFGRGGYGMLGSLLSYNASCSLVYHQGAKVTSCQLAPPPKVLQNEAVTRESFENLFLPPMSRIKETPAASSNQQSKGLAVMTERTIEVPRKVTTTEEVPPFPNIKATMQSSALWEDSVKLPRWMKQYFSWHRDQLRRINEGNWQEYRYIVMACLKRSPKCGGTSDRLRPLPFVVRVAAETDRLLFIVWEKPARLEEFLLPPLGGVNWQIPHWLLPKLKRMSIMARSADKLVELAYENHTLIESRVQSHDHGSKYYDFQGEKNGEGQNTFRRHYHDCWYSMFTPVPAIAKLVEKSLEEMSLVPREYSFAHVRAFYGIKNKQRDLVLVKNWTINALNCLSSLRPGGPFFFTSDSLYAKKMAIQYGSEKNVSVVARLDDKDPLHMDLADNWETRDPSEFYPIFVDLYLMSLGRCMTYNVGGYAKWGQLLSGQFCQVRHWTKGVDKKSANKAGCNWTEPTSENRMPVILANKIEKKPLFLPPMTAIDGHLPREETGNVYST
jgi:hypothetical protein